MECTCENYIKWTSKFTRADISTSIFLIQSKDETLVKDTWHELKKYYIEALDVFKNNISMHFPIFRDKSYMIQSTLTYAINKFKLNYVLSKIEVGEENISTLILNSKSKLNIINAYEYLKKYTPDVFLPILDTSFSKQKKIKMMRL